MIARPNFGTRKAEVQSRHTRNIAVQLLLEPLIACYTKDHGKMTRGGIGRKKNSRDLVTIREAAQAFLEYMLKYIRPFRLRAEVITRNELLSPETLEVALTYCGPRSLRCQMDYGSKGTGDTCHATAASQFGPLNQPMMTFSSAGGTPKFISPNKPCQQATRQYPFVHILCFLWFEQQLPSEYNRFLTEHRAYICVLTNAFSQIHGGPRNPEKKRQVAGGWDSFTSHIGPFEGGHFVLRVNPHLEPGVAAAAAQVGARADAPVAPYAGSAVVTSEHFGYGTKKGKIDGVKCMVSQGPRHGTNDDLVEFGEAPPASAFYAVSAQNAVVALNSARLHGSCDHILCSRMSINPCKWTLVAALKGARTDASPEPSDAVAVFAKGVRLYTTARDKRKNIARVRYDKGDHGGVQLRRAAAKAKASGKRKRFCAKDFTIRKRPGRKKKKNKKTVK
eukprot:g4757.t1